MKVKLSAVGVPNNFLMILMRKEKTKTTNKHFWNQGKRSKVMSGLKKHVLDAITKIECTIK